MSEETTKTERLPTCAEDDKECQEKYRNLITASEVDVDKRIGVETSKKGGKRSKRRRTTRQRKSRRHRRRTNRGRK